MGLRVAVVVLLTLGACHRLHPLELVPAATGGSEITARVVSTAGANGFYDYAIELSNTTNTPVDIDLSAARVDYVTMLDGATLTSVTVSGGIGEPPAEPPPQSPPPRLVVGPKETRSVWLGFVLPQDPRVSDVRREELTVPGVGTVAIIEDTPEHPRGVRTYRGRRRALSLVLRSSFEVAPNNWVAYVPYEVGAALQRCQLRLEVHARALDRLESATPNYALTSAIATGVGATWSSNRYFAFYLDADYERVGIEGVPAENAAALGAGLSAPLWFWNPGSAYGTWRLPIASLRVGGVETIAPSGFVAALRVGLEVAPAWLW